MIKRFLSIALFVVFSIATFSQIPNGYYTAADGKTGATLKTALYNIIKGHTDLGYDGLYNVYTTSDNLPSGKVWDMYSIKADGTANYFYSHISGDRCGSYSTEGDCYNREHTFCDSWLGKASPQRSDAHHILPTDGYVNNRRSSYPHGKVGTVSWTSSNGSKLGNSDPSTGYSGIVFEPIDEFKGDFARMYFYVVTRYETQVASWASNGSAGELLDGTSFPAFKSWFKTLMLQWSQQDPVSQKEIDRNNAIYALQHNRNPYIDHPEYAEAVWGSGTIALNFTSSAVTSATVGMVYNYSVSVAGPVGSTLTITAPTKPGWLTLSSTGNTTATLSGTPATSGSFDVTLSVTDGSSTKTQSFSINVAALEGLKITSTPVTMATTGSAYSYSITTSDVANPGATISISATTKPSWLTLTSTGNGTATLSGTPMADDAGSNSVTISANDGFTTVTQPFAITVSVAGTSNKETFTNIGAASSSYTNFTWTGDDGSTWSATSARTDQAIVASNKAICLKNVADTYIESGTLSGGCGSINFKNLQVFTGTGGTLTLLINGVQIGSPFAYSTTEQIASFTNINVVGNFVIKIVNNGNARPVIDDVTWTTYTIAPPNISNISVSPINPTTNDDVVVSATITDNGTVKEATLDWGLSASTLDHTLTMTLDGNVYKATIPKQSAGTVYIRVNAKDDLDAVSTLDYSYAIIQNVKPSIADISNAPISPFTGETIKISATITDIDGTIEDTWLKWGTSPSALTNQLTMVLVGGKYETNIPAQIQAGTIYLSINARDDSGAETSSLYSFVITQNQTPSITNISWTPQNPLIGGIITFSATISDSDGSIQEAYLNWGTTSGNLTTKVNMTLNNGKYEGVIPAQAQARTIFFMVSGKDNLNLTGSSAQQSFTISTPNVLPTITNTMINPQNPLMGQPITVFSTITDSDGTIQEAFLMWGTVSGNLNNKVDMVLNGGIYEGIIPSQSIVVTIYYTINAKDNSGETKTTSQSSFTVTAPNILPTISDITLNPQNPLTGQAVLVSTNITDSDGAIQEAYLMWGMNSGDLANKVVMTLNGGSYKGTIPAQSVAGTIYYTINAKDNSGETKTTNQSSFTVIAPNVLPIISDITFNPQSPLTGQEIMVSATITDSDGTIQEAYINWGVTGNLIIKANMTLNGGKYEGIIPSQIQAGTIYFMVSAKDNSGDISTSSEDSITISPSTDINDINGSLIKIYPNPAKNSIMVESSDIIDHLVISNIIGEKVVDLPVIGKKQFVDISRLNSGIYFVSVSGNNFRNTTKIIVNK
ncbi:MAG: T9SS type A sorting domain-containing protein [Bacteroidales bacterium]|nr:T9SS type A sorting domain-containing protein [Bacteroidales bacterium]